MNTLTVDGVDLTPFIALGGIKWSRNDIDGSNAGRTLDGTMQRDRITTKIRLDITFRPLNDAELSTVLNAIQPEYISVTYNDPLYGTRTMEAYSNNVPATVLLKQTDGSWLWGSVTAPIIER